jgi:hypothetical protein
MRGQGGALRRIGHAEHFMMQLMVDDLDAWWTHLTPRRQAT